jgi:membrane-associated protein
MFEALLRRAAGLPAAAIVAVTFALAMGESALLVDLVVPGETGMVFLGAVAAERKIPLLVAAAACAAGALIGDSLGFFIGRRWGWAAMCRFRWIRKRIAPKAEQAAEYLERRPGAAMFAGRWLGALRALVPLVAGASEMRYRRFILWDIAAAVTWSPIIVGVGYFVGRPAIRFVDRFEWVGLVLAAVVVAVLVLRSRASGTRAAGA